MLGDWGLNLLIIITKVFIIDFEESELSFSVFIGKVHVFVFILKELFSSSLESGYYIDVISEDLCLYAYLSDI